MSKFNLGIKACGIFLLWAATAIVLPAQTTGDVPRAPTFTTLYSFNNYDGSNPVAGLVQATDGSLYGTTPNGGVINTGTVFKITPRGTLTTLHSFLGTDGYYPEAGLVQGTDGNFYGTTSQYGTFNDGTVFKIAPRGTLTTLYSFDGSDGQNSTAGLVEGTDGNFYGSTSFGANGYGTIFKITPSGSLTTLHKFHGTDGGNPEARLVQATDGNFYGTTFGGGANGDGTVFRITPSGMVTTLHSFDGLGGANPTAGLVQATDGNFYGITYGGGNSGGACPDACGTVFKVTPNGTLTTLYNFQLYDGGNPVAGLVQGTDGNFYGSTTMGGAPGAFCTLPFGCGTVFKITPNGTLTTLGNFCSQSNCSDGDGSEATLVQDTDGKFYGTTSQEGTNGYGTVFSMSVELGPFVETQPASGKVGAAVKILGTNLTGATGVTFNGTAAAFTVKTKSEITTNVPSGATTGTVQVVTPSGALSSNVPFRVTP